MMCKRIAYMIAVVFVTLNIFCGCSGHDRYRYDYTQKEDACNSDTIAAFGSSSSPITDYFEHAITESDLIIEGEVISVGDTADRPLAGTEETVKFNIKTTIYTISVIDVWYGTYDGDSLILEIYGDNDSGPTKPHQYDRGVFLLEKYGDNYTLSAAENSVFIQNPPNGKLYAFSYHDEVAMFDKQSTSVLKEAMETKLNDIKANGASRQVFGSIGLEYQTMYEASLSEEVTEDK